ncbi:glycerol-3-phosphate responsive antiterminator [Treponema primitia]|uniref:glycerol-3-phosphate responsive antiterminator n=1 Tax=Treponema primitia TaxID=88058 RepID=UPI0002554C38|nr:glycerol-3-phosphate responsive antiterminator [Treponema primitia]
MKTILVKKRRVLAPEEFFALLQKTPVISAVKSAEALEQQLETTSDIVFILFGDILSIPATVARIKDAGKIAMVHLDLIEGLSAREIAVDFLWENTRADGILSTKANLIKHAKLLGFLTIQRFFVLDSMALLNIEKQFPLDHADAVEILPGVMPKIINKIAHITKKPVIAGGLISDTEDIQNALKAGAIAVSTSNPELLQGMRNC